MADDERKIEAVLRRRIGKHFAEMSDEEIKGDFRDILGRSPDDPKWPEIAEDIRNRFREWTAK